MKEIRSTVAVNMINANDKSHPEIDLNEQLFVNNEYWNAIIDVDMVHINTNDT